MNDDHELRSRLERLASSAGDPPEHGLERVAARRHRRLHRRRGAVATAAVLAVLAAVLIVQPFGDRRERVTASEAAMPSGAVAEVPSVLEVRCEPDGIDVPIASVRPQRDGMHVHVTNGLGSPTVVDVESHDWSSGPMVVPAGMSELRQPVPPGVLTIGCQIGGRPDQRRVDLVDTAHFYHAPRLSCDESDRKTLTDVPVAPEDLSIILATRRGLAPKVVQAVADDEIGPAIGYPSQRLNDATTDPMVQVGVPGEVVALVHVRGPDGATSPPWTTLSTVEICAAALASPATSSTAPPTTTTSTTPPRAQPPA